MLVDIRAHHLINILYCLGKKRGREERIAAQLEEFVKWRGPGIIEKSKQPIQDIAEKPELRMKIIIGGVDGFCDGCNKQEDCEIGGGPKLLDITTIEALSLKEGKDYSLEEVLEKAFQAIQVLTSEEKIRPSHRIILQQVAVAIQDTP